MLTATGQYFAELAETSGAAWNRFWFTPRTTWHLALLRQMVGVLALVWLATYSGQLTSIFGGEGWLPPSSVHQVMTNGDPSERVPGFSHLFFIQSDSAMWMSHAACLFVFLLVTLGIFPWVTTPLGLLVALSYIHRGPMLTGLFEPVLCMLLLYLSLAPRDGLGGLITGKHRAPASWLANLVTRLVQVHLCAFYLLIGLSKLGSAPWWTGEAAWLLMSDSQHRLVDVTPWVLHDYLFEGVTHAWVLFDLSFPLLVWNRAARPLLVGLSVVVWTLAALITGMLGFAMLMIVANLVFVAPDTVASWSAESKASGLRALHRQKSRGIRIINALTRQAPCGQFAARIADIDSAAGERGQCTGDRVGQTMATQFRVLSRCWS